MDSRHRCPRNLKGYPTSPCQMGKAEVDKNCKEKESKCPWGINDAGSNYCMWSWLAKYPFEHTNTEISRLLNISTQRVGQIKENAVEALRKKPEVLKEITQFLIGGAYHDGDEAVVPGVALDDSLSVGEGETDEGSSDV